jgi:hypothetical protein
MVDNCVQVSCDKHPKVRFAGRLFPFSTGMYVLTKEHIATICFLSHDIRCGLTARISRFHRGGRGSIPRTGTSSFASLVTTPRPASFVLKEDFSWPSNNLFGLTLSTFDPRVTAKEELSGVMDDNLKR